MHAVIYSTGVERTTEGEARLHALSRSWRGEGDGVRSALSRSWRGEGDEEERCGRQRITDIVPSKRCFASKTRTLSRHFINTNTFHRKHFACTTQSPNSHNNNNNNVTNRIQQTMPRNCCTKLGSLHCISEQCNMLWWLQYSIAVQATDLSPGCVESSFDRGKRQS